MSREQELEQEGEIAADFIEELLAPGSRELACTESHLSTTNGSSRHLS